jgi:hypothetical protein
MRGGMVKGLAKLEDRLRHGLSGDAGSAKCVDAGPFQEGRLLPSDGPTIDQETVDVEAVASIVLLGFGSR